VGSNNNPMDHNPGWSSRALSKAFSTKVMFQDIVFADRIALASWNGAQISGANASFNCPIQPRMCKFLVNMHYYKEHF
jgi:hypothetical protein